VEVLDPALDAGCRFRRTHHRVQNIQLKVARTLAIRQEGDESPVWRVLWETIGLGPECQNAGLARCEINLANPGRWSAFELVNDRPGEHGPFILRGIYFRGIADLPRARLPYADANALGFLINLGVPDISFHDLKPPSCF